MKDVLNAKMPVSKIAAEIGRHRSTVYREIKRNSFSDDELTYLNGYYGMNAQRYASDRRARRRKLIRLKDLRSHVIAQLKIGWTPEQIAGRLGYDGYKNLMIETNIAQAAHEADVERFLFLGSSCIYPKFAPQPIPEDSLLTGALEPTNEWYAIAKIAGIKLMQAYRQQYGRDWISAMPTNLYGPGDNYDLNSSHVLPALLRKFHEAKAAGATSVELWGSGTPLREFMHCDDLADALVFLLKEYSGHSHVNVGSGTEVSIRALAETIARVVGYEAELVFDASKPDGTPRKLMDSTTLHRLGWNQARPLEDGIRQTYAHALQTEFA